MVWEFWVSHIFVNTGIFHLHFSHSVGGILVSYCGFNWHLPNLNGVECLFKYLLATWLSSFLKYLLKTFAHFSYGLSVFFLLICKSSLYSLHMSSFSVICTENILSHSVCCLFIFLISNSPIGLFCVLLKTFLPTGSHEDIFL